MEAFIIGLSTQRMYRDLFWHLAICAPLTLLVLVALLAVPRYRRAAAIGLLASIAGAVLVAVVFHYSYTITIWGGHASAIRFLDEGALRAGFAASAVIYGLGCLGHWICARRMQRT
jgi:hypothetical protein